MFTKIKRHPCVIFLSFFFFFLVLLSTLHWVAGGTYSGCRSAQEHAPTVSNAVSSSPCPLQTCSGRAQIAQPRQWRKLVMTTDQGQIESLFRVDMVGDVWPTNGQLVQVHQFGETFKYGTRLCHDDVPVDRDKDPECSELGAHPFAIALDNIGSQDARSRGDREQRTGLQERQGESLVSFVVICGDGDLLECREMPRQSLYGAIRVNFGWQEQVLDLAQEIQEHCRTDFTNRAESKALQLRQMSSLVQGNDLDQPWL